MWEVIMTGPIIIKEKILKVDTDVGKDLVHEYKPKDQADFISQERK